MNYGQTFALSKFLTGASKALGIANQVIPLYSQTKPLFNNVRKAYDLIKVNNQRVDSRPPSVRRPNLDNNKQIKRTYHHSGNSPQFFI